MSVDILIGDCRTLLQTISDSSVRCCVTSPPYFGLRDYGTGVWSGGDPECDHIWRNARNDVSPDDLARRAAAYGTGQETGSHVSAVQFKDICGKCGATRQDQQIGLEPTIDQYVTELVDVFREVRRVLTDDGTLWLNLGDSYAGSNALTTNEKSLKCKQGTSLGTHGVIPSRQLPTEIKSKNLIGVPWRVAFALQADGWYLRQDIIWAKPNPMPESVTDRCTKSHEYIFLLSKSHRYYFDAAAIREPFVTENGMGWGKRIDTHDSMKTDGEFTKQQSRKGQGMTAMKPHEDGRNKRSVWTVATQPYAEAHFAVFPSKLIEPCILAGSAPGDTVLDPFAGSGTTLMVAQKFNRNAIGIELHPEYESLIRTRIAQQVLQLA